MTDQNGLDIRSFRYFVAVAEELNFGRAARRLHLSQPPLSRQIRQLELSLGFPLFVRDRQRVELTDAGRVFLDEARRAVAQFDHAVHVAEMAASGALGTVRVGFCFGLEASLGPMLSKDLEQAGPDWKMAAASQWSHLQVREVQERRLDFGLVRLPLGRFEGLTLECIAREPLVAAVGTAGARRPGMAKLGTFQQRQFVALRHSAAPLLQEHIQRICRQCGLEMQIQAEADSFEEMLRVVGSTDLVAVVPASTMMQAEPRVRWVRLSDRIADVPIGLLYRPGIRTTLHDGFLGVLKRMAESTRFAEAF